MTSSSAASTILSTWYSTAAASIYFRRDKRRDYVPAVSRLIKPGGYLMIKCFSHLETRPEGPYRIAPSEIENLFGDDEILAMQHTTFNGSNVKTPPKALFCVLRKH